MSKQLQPPVKTKPQTVIKIESPEPEIVEITIDDILDSSDSDEEIIEDIKIDVVEHILCEDSIKSEIEHETKYSELIETQVFEKTKNSSCKNTENIIQSENLCKIEGTSDGNVSNDTGQGVVEVQDSNEHINALGNLKNDKQLMLSSSNDLDGISVTNRKPERETTSCEKDKEKLKIIEAPVIPVKSHEFTTLSKGKHVCNHCQYSCKRLDHLKRHITKLHREIIQTYQCTYCPVKTKYIWGLRRHIKEKHTDTKEILKCHLCDMAFKVKRNLAQHMLVHVTHEQMKDKLTLCPLCGKGFKAAFSMKLHVRFVHNKEPKKRLKCEQCEYTSVTLECLRIHVNKHHTRHPSPGSASSTLERFCCDKCNYTTYRAPNFLRHKLIHLEPEEIQYFRCYHCPYKCKQKANIEYHVWTHFKDKGMANPYKRQKPRIKNLEKRYHCNHCDYKTYARSNLESHKLTHLKPEEIQYVYCYHCSFKTKHKVYLKRHIFRHSKKEKMKSHSKKKSITKHVKTRSKIQIK